MQKKYSGSKIIEVMMGQCVVERAPCILVSGGIGSCIIVALYDSKLKQGCLAHIMLCDSHGAMNSSDYCGQKGLESMLHRLLHMGSRFEDIVAKVAGGAKMFLYDNDDIVPIGRQNVNRIKDLLKNEGIPLAGEDTGGCHSRSVEFDLSSGLMFVKKIGDKEMVV